MARQTRCWRTRHLFPRTAALSIQSRRGPHHARLWLKSFVESPSLWTTSVLAGMLAIVLTLLLFVVGPPPEVALETAGTPESRPTETEPAARIALSVQQGAFPIGWDEREQLVVQSQPARPSIPIAFALSNSGWSAASQTRTASLAGSVGPVAGQLVLPAAQNIPLIESSDLPPDSPQITSVAQPGVVVEKVWLSETDQHNILEYALIVRNDSFSAIDRVVVREVVPDISQLVDVEPPAALSRQEELMWELGTLDPGDELQLHVSYLPAEAGALETYSVTDVQTRIGVVTLVSEATPPALVADTAEPVIIEPETTVPEPVLPAGLSGDTTPVQPAEAVLPADDEDPPPAAAPPRDVFPFLTSDPDAIVPVDEDPPAVVMPAAPEAVLPAEAFPFDRNEPLEPRPRPLTESVPVQPLLRVHSTSPEVVVRGEVVTTIYEISNEGTAAAEGVTLTVHLTDELLHRHGADVEHSIDRIEPGEVRRARLLTRAREAGTATLDAALTHDGENAGSELTYIRVSTSRADPTTGEWGASESSAEASPPATLR